MITIRKLLLRNMIVAVFAATGSLYLLWIYNEYVNFNTETQRMKAHYIQMRKAILKTEVTRVLDYIRYMEEQTEIRLKKTIKERVEEAHAIASNIYRENKGIKPDAEIEEMIKNALRPIRFNNGNGYYFAFSMEGIEMLFPDRPEMEGQNMLSVQGAGGKWVVKDMIELVASKDQGFYRYSWSKPGELKKDFRKIAFVKYFEPLDWGIGTGIYVKDMMTDIQNDVLSRVAAMRFGKDGYFFGSEYGGNPLFTNGVVTRGGENLWDLTDANGVKIIQEMDNAAKNPEGGFVGYTWHKLNSDIPLPKLVFVQSIPGWQWIIGSGIYMDDIDRTILSRKNQLYDNFKEKSAVSLGLFLFISLICYVWGRRMAHKVHHGILTFSEFFEKAASTSVAIDPDSLVFDEFRNIAVAANQMVEVRRQSLEALELNEKRYEKSQALGKVGNWEYHFSTRKLWGSKESKLIFEFDPDEDFFSMDEVESCIPEKISVHHAMVTQVEEQSTNQMEFRIVTRNSRTHKILFALGELERDAQGNPLKINGVIQDITDRKNLEKELVQAHKMEAVGTLSGGVAHEFNNILGVILGNAELAIEDLSANNAVGHFFDEIKTACLRGKEIVSQLLSFSRRDEHPMHPIKLDKIVKNAVVFLRASLPSTIEFSESIQKNCHTIVGDPTQIHQIMINLCNNAAHAMESSGGKLSIKLKNVFLTRQLRSQDQCIEPGEYVRLTISDTGVGIPEETMEKIFNPFFTTKAVDKGSGMGLAVVHGIMKAHDGIIKIYSRVNEGTTCECYFPPGKEEAMAETGSAHTVKTGSETILFVDDDPHIAKMGEQILTRLGYRSVIETDPESALARFKADPDTFQLVITDMTMPVMSGDRLIEKLREITPRVKAIICTGYSSRMDRMDAAEAGAAAYLMKPIEISVLAETIRKVLDQ